MYTYVEKDVITKYYKLEIKYIKHKILTDVLLLYR